MRYRVHARVDVLQWEQSVLLSMMLILDRSESGRGARVINFDEVLLQPFDLLHIVRYRRQKFRVRRCSRPRHLRFRVLAVA